MQEHHKYASWVYEDFSNDEKDDAEQELSGFDRLKAEKEAVIEA